jgi:hypothetical protein
MIPSTSVIKSLADRTKISMIKSVFLKEEEVKNEYNFGKSIFIVKDVNHYVLYLKEFSRIIVTKL